MSLVGLGFRPAVMEVVVTKAGFLFRKALRRARSWASRRVWDTRVGCECNVVFGYNWYYAEEGSNVSVYMSFGMNRYRQVCRYLYLYRDIDEKLENNSPRQRATYAPITTIQRDKKPNISPSSWPSEGIGI